MLVISVRNVHEALPECLYNLRALGQVSDSRNGPVKRFPFPVTTIYQRPTERVVFWHERDANPFFHLFEALWMLAGRNDISFLAQFVKRMMDYSDDGVTQHGAYGYRWRAGFGRDQLVEIADRLRRDTNDRRCVLQMWDLHRDLNVDSRDLPCNTHVYFKVRNGLLDMTVCNRSNDIVLGAYGANAVHFSFLQEYMAARIGVGVGRYYQISDDLHLYLNDTSKDILALADLAADPFYGQRTRSPYEGAVRADVPLLEMDPSIFDAELKLFLDDPLGSMGIRSHFIRRVAIPMFYAHHIHKTEGRTADAIDFVTDNCLASDWRMAAREWFQRRIDRKAVQDAQ